jgi:protein-S-isoprenylcysteine O-methyltransferase Ste14
MLFVTLIYRPSVVPPFVLSPICSLSLSATREGMKASPSSLTPSQINFHLSILLLAAFFTISGFRLRTWCFDIMGERFTYTLTIVKDHELVTGGPYAYVRHPGYTGGWMILFGVGLAHLGTFIVASGIARTNDVLDCVGFETVFECSKWLYGIWIVFIMYASYGLDKRSKVEDALMKKTFGKKWIEWSDRVKYRYIPGVV